MKKYSVYCNFFGKKIRHDVFADSEESAIRLTRLKVAIDKVTCDVPKTKTEKDRLDEVASKLGVNFSDLFKGL